MTLGYQSPAERFQAFIASTGRGDHPKWTPAMQSGAVAQQRQRGAIVLRLQQGRHQLVIGWGPFAGPDRQARRATQIAIEAGIRHPTFTKTRVKRSSINLCCGRNGRAPLAERGSAHCGPLFRADYIRRPGAHPDPAIILQDLGVHQSQLSGKHLQAMTRLSRQSIIRILMKRIYECQKPVAPDRRYDSELSHVASDHIRQLDRLTHQHRPRAVQYQTLCCSGVFTSTKRIIGLVTASQIASAVLLTLDMRLDVTRWHQPDIVAPASATLAPSDVKWRRPLFQPSRVPASRQYPISCVRKLPIPAARKRP